MTIKVCNQQKNIDFRQYGDPKLVIIYRPFPF